LSRTAPDQSVRDAALAPDRSFILEAPAGSGKTDLLTARYLGLLEGVRSPRQILAVTFTRKAAHEMQSRILGILDRTLAGAEPESPWDARMLELARRAAANPRLTPEVLRNPSSYRIGTFHSFCGSLVKAFPVESGVPPGGAVLGDLDQESAREGAVADLLEDILHGGRPGLEPALEARLAARGGSLDRVSGELLSLLERRDQLEAFGQALRKDGADPGRTVRDAISRLMSGHLAPARDYLASRPEAYAALRSDLAACGAPAAAHLPEVLPPMTAEAARPWIALAAVFLAKAGTLRKTTHHTIHGKGFAKTQSWAFLKETPEEVTASLSAVRLWSPEAGLEGLDELADVFSLSAAALEVLSRRIPAAGLDYIELELAALRCLRWQDVPSRGLVFLQEHLRHLLVDEAQDMNDLQVDILSRLTEGWQPGDGRTVFVVGDPKQSIYRFRRAEVALFSGLAREGIPREGEAPFALEPLRITANFRSDPRLVRFCNALFERVMADPDPVRDEVPFGPGEPFLEEDPEPAPVAVASFERFTGDDGEPSDDDPREREAAWVASRIAALHRERPGDTIALLYPARTVLDHFVRAIRDAGVPLRLLDGEDLTARPEVRHLENLFTALARPFDDIAWAAALRAPWCRLPMAALCGLAEREGPWSRRVLALADEEGPARAFAGAAREALRLFGREPYARTLLRLWEDAGGPRATAASYGAAGVANALAFLSKLDGCGILPTEEALDVLGRILARSYAPPDPQAAHSPVSALTIHRAKGLEFDHVFAAYLDRSPLSGYSRNKPVLAISRWPSGDRPVLVAAQTGFSGREENLAYHLLDELEKGRAQAEDRRLFYVAATRARKSLTLTGQRSPRQKECPLKRLLEAVACGEGLGAPFSEMDVTLLENPEAPREARGAAPLLPVLDPPPFDPEPLPYAFAKASDAGDEAEEETALPPRHGGGEEPDPHARPRGTVIHRILETLARARPLPSEKAVAAALVDEGMPAADAASEAGPAIEEALAAWSFPGFSALRKRAEALLPEWGVEDYRAEGGTLRLGRIDLALRLPEGFALVDYKTARRPDSAPEQEWFDYEVAQYRHQLAAYADMVRALEGAPAAVTAYLFFTAEGRLVEV